MINKKRLLSYMALSGHNYRTLSIALGINKNTFGNKINGKVPFNTYEVARICEVCNINDPQAKIDIFLSGMTQ